ncbi:MAG: caspase family protein [Deltaproteobacteria bacterium]|nr:caspase family protein [Deltaproteobacteria bacterium]MBW2034131.1 caspase family protein [Deltaproteobacteria bacterium]
MQAYLLTERYSLWWESNVSLQFGQTDHEAGMKFPPALTCEVYGSIQRKNLMKVYTMKRHKLFIIFSCIFVFLFLMALGCVTTSTSVLKMPESLPPIVKEYKHITLNANIPGMMNTGVYLNDGETYSVLATGSIDLWPAGLGHAPPADYKYHDVRPEHGWPLMARVGEKKGVMNRYFSPLWQANGHTQTAWSSGNLYLGVRDGPVDSYGEPLNPRYYNHNTGFFKVDIIVWHREDYVQIVDFFEEMKGKDQDNKAVIDALAQAITYKEISLAKAKASKEIEETEKEIQALKEEPEQKKEQAVETATKGKPVLKAKPPTADAGKQEKVARLEGKLAKLTETLGQLERLKKELEEERKKSSLLAKELEEKEKSEKDLLVKLEYGSKAPPVIVIASPQEGSKVEVKIITFSGVAEDDQGLTRLEIFINGKPIKKKADRGVRVTREKSPTRLDFRERVPLERGENRIKIRAVDSDGLTCEKTLTVHYVERRKNIWAVVIGINNYPNIRKLKYAVNDAKLFYNHLVKYNQIPAENVNLLINQEATLTKLRSMLGTHLKNRAGKEDMVIIFFAGHGATEKDVMSPDGDGLEKYLLPYDADPKDLYATALPMGEVSRIFSRIRSERLVFIADSCYSGASGGRTIGITDIRANISEAFLERIASGKGRVIITASGANEVSAENDELRHGVFTYYLVEGLRGKADADKDGLITIDEVYRYVSEHVPRATGQEQHPIKKGTVKGRLILSIVN